MSPIAVVALAPDSNDDENGDDGNGGDRGDDATNAQGFCSTKLLGHPSK